MILAKVLIVTCIPKISGNLRERKINVSKIEAVRNDNDSEKKLYLIQRWP